MLAYWTNKDAEQMERIFKASRLYLDDAELQEKWDTKHSAGGKTYGQMTIEKAASTSRQL